MTPVSRPLSGAVLSFDLHEELRTVREQIGPSGRSARTLLKNDPLRMTLVGLGAGGEMAEHSAEGPISVQVIEGSVEFEVGGEVHALDAGALIALGGGVVHTVRSQRGGIFLLTVAQSVPDAPGRDARTAP